jgi:hypothetical protein
MRMRIKREGSGDGRTYLLLISCKMFPKASLHELVTTKGVTPLPDMLGFGWKVYNNISIQFLEKRRLRQKRKEVE